MATEEKTLVSLLWTAWFGASMFAMVIAIIELVHSGNWMPACVIAVALALISTSLYARERLRFTSEGLIVGTLFKSALVPYSSIRRVYTGRLDTLFVFIDWEDHARPKTIKFLKLPYLPHIPAITSALRARRRDLEIVL